MTFSLIAPKRQLVQTLTTLLLLGIPFVRVGGDSLLRLDAGSRTLLFLGARIRIEEFYLFLIAVLILVFGFLFVTMVFGRVWCGWFCPQTTVTDLAESFDRLVARHSAGTVLSAGVRHLFYLIVSCLVAANLVWYFIPPGEFLSRLLAWTMGPVAGIALVTTSLLVYLDLALVRRSFCTAVCPYGRIQLMAMDRNTLTLEFDPARTDACLRCGACVRNCPMGIDIRDGLQIECINCGRCLDACRKVMAVRGGAGLIHYTFGVTADGGGRPFNARSLLLAGVMLLLCGALAVAVAGRQEATMKVQRGGEGRVQRLADGALVNYFTAYLENRSTTAAVYSLSLEPVPGYRAELVGPVRDIQVAANANRRVDFAVRIEPAPTARHELRLRLHKDGKILAVSGIPLLVK
jgi:cytochrome c oxidase accessory protein FixG